LWYRWTAPISCGFTIDTAGSGFDTLLAVYTGGALATLTPVAFNDDYNGPTSRVVLNAIAGTTYNIAADGFNGAAGNLILNWSVAGACGAPLLSYVRQGDRLVLSWDANYSGFNLESTLTLSAGTWSAVSPPPITASGRNWVTNVISGPVGFYRLRRP
jgi:hypothetical protein